MAWKNASKYTPEGAVDEHEGASDPHPSYLLASGQRDFPSVTPFDSVASTGLVSEHVREYATGADTTGNYYRVATVRITAQYKHAMVFGTLQVGASADGSSQATTFSLVVKQQAALGSTPYCTLNAQSDAGGDMKAYIVSTTASETVVELYWLNKVAWSVCFTQLTALTTLTGATVETEATLPSPTTLSGTEIGNQRGIKTDGNGYAMFDDLRMIGASGNCLVSTQGAQGGGGTGLSESAIKYTGTYLYANTASESVSLGVFANRWDRLYVSRINVLSGTAGNAYIDVYQDSVAAPGAGYTRLSTLSSGNSTYLNVQGSGVRTDGHVLAYGGFFAGYGENTNPGFVFHKTASSVDVATSYFTVTTGQSVFTHQNVGAAGTAPAGISFKAEPDYGSPGATSNGFVEFFNGTHTTGDTYIAVHKGDGTSAKNAEIGGQGRDTYFCADNGALAVGKTSATTGTQLDVDGVLASTGTSPGLLLSESSSAPLTLSAGYGLVWADTSGLLTYTDDQNDDRPLALQGFANDLCLVHTLRDLTNQDHDVDIDWSAGNVQTLDIDDNVTTITFAAPPATAVLRLIVRQTVGGKTLAGWPSSVKWPAGSAPSVTLAPGKADILEFIYDPSASVYLGSIIKNYS